MKQKRVLLFIQSKFTALQGNWEWDMQTNAVFCSDVILSSPTDFIGTKGIIHPDDLEQLKNDLTKMAKGESINLKFRMITTYGAIKALSGEEVAEDDDLGFVYPETDLFERESTLNLLFKEKEQGWLKNEGHQLSERQTGTGIWYINTSTNETFYSDQVFMIYGLQPQSLNMHPHTFSSFIHHEDQAFVTESFEKAYKEKLPLHIEFRIVWANGTERFVRQNMQWSFSMHGAYVLHGTIQDITEQKERDLLLERIQSEFQFLKQINKQQDQDTNTGHWYLNLLIRKTSFSDNFYRIFGLKAQSIIPSLDLILNYVHPDDQKLVEEAYRKVKYQHTPPNIEFRIIRPDGKMRYIRQTGKIEIFAQAEMVMVGIIQDITQQKILESKVHQNEETNLVQKFVLDRIEDRAKTGSMVWDLSTDKVTWSDYLYTLLGQRINAINPSPKQVINYIHPGDQKTYSNELSLALQDQQREAFELKVVSRGEIKQVKTQFTLLTHEERKILLAVFRDVTEETKQQQQLTESVQLAEQLTESFPDRVMITDVSNNIILWNQKCEEKYKQKKDQVTGVNFFEVFPELKKEETIGHFNEVLRGKAVHLHSVLTPFKNYDNWHMITLRNSQEEVIGILHIIQDVTGDIKLRQQLSERLSFIENLVNTSVDRIIALDKNMNYLYWNKKSEEFYGLPKEQVIGKNILEIFPRLLNDPSYNEFRRAMRGETVHLTESGSPEQGYYYETYLIPIKNETGEVTAVLWITHDFSKEYQLIAEQKIAHEILDTVDEACFELDFESKLTYVNRKAEQLWNRSREELLRQNLWDILPQAVDSPLYIAINTVLEDRVVVQQEFLSPIHDRWIFVMAKPSENGVVVLFLDTHELKQTQKKTIQVLHALNECYYELDQEYRVTFMNQKAEEFFNKSSAEITGKVLWDVFPEVKGTSLYKAMIKALEENVPVRDVFLSPLKGNNSLVSITPIGDGIAVIFMSMEEIRAIQLTPPRNP